MNGKRYCACWEGFFFHTNGVGACKIYHLPGEGGESVKVSKTLGLRKSSEKKKVKHDSMLLNKIKNISSLVKFFASCFFWSDAILCRSFGLKRKNERE